jgi:sucrose phosphorylase
LLTDFLTNFSKNKVKMVRLDAVGYVIKKPGTTCFFVEPEIYQFLDWITELAHSLGIELLPEVHAHYSTQFRLAEHGHWIYDFILPYLILEALHTNRNTGLCNYLRMRPHKQFTMLDCHDGIPVKPDMNDLVKTSEAQKIVDICMEQGANLSRIFSSKHKDPDGFDVHQIRCTYYSALKSNDDSYIASRAIQFFAPGIPQVYYVGLLAGENDMEGIKNSNDGREINRHNYNVAEIEQSLQKPVVQRLIKLIQFRNEHPAFDGKFSVTETDEHFFHMRWENENTFCQLNVNLQTKKADIRYISGEGKLEKYTL